MPEWLESGTVTTVLGSALSEQIDDAALAAVIPGVRAYVEGKRKDLVVVTVDEEEVETSTFTPTPDVILGAALLAWRTYNRRNTPLGVLGASEDGYAGIIRDDPDIARYLGIGAAGKFAFGGYHPDEELVEVT